MRAAWTINPIPPTPQQQSTHQQHYLIANQKSPPLTQEMPTKVPEEYVSNEFAVKRVFLTQNKNASYFDVKTNSKEPFQQPNHDLQIVSLNIF